MKLLTQEIKKKLPPLYSQEDKGGKAVAIIKFFTPDSSPWSWYITEGQPVLDENGIYQDYQFFGLVHGFEKELGYFSLKELQSVKGPLGLSIERDLYWTPKTLE